MFRPHSRGEVREYNPTGGLERLGACGSSSFGIYAAARSGER
jgi:hypothetical protein